MLKIVEVFGTRLMVFLSHENVLLVCLVICIEVGIYYI